MDDPYVLLHIYENLGKDVPPSAPLYGSLVGLRDVTLRKLLLVPLPPDLEMRMKEVARERLLDKAMDRQKVRNLVPQLLKAPAKEVQTQLHSPNEAIRLVAIGVTVHRRLDLEEDLIELLGDPNSLVQEKAHQALVRLARGTDFGPGSFRARHDREPSSRQMARIMAKWRTWLALQETARAEASSKAITNRPASTK